MLEYYICEINNAKLSLYFFIVSVIKHKIYAINPIICVFMKSDIIYSKNKITDFLIKLIEHTTK